MKRFVVGLALAAAVLSVQATGMNISIVPNGGYSMQAPPQCTPGHVAVPIYVDGRIVGWKCV